MLQPPSKMDGLTRQEDLVERAKAGDEKVWKELFDEHYPPVFRFFRSRVASSEQAEDLAAEVFLQAFRSINRFTWQGTPFPAWLFGIARRVLASYYRSRRPIMQFNDHAEGAKASDDLLQVEINDILARLPDEYRDALKLRFIVGLSGVEAAATMGRSHGSFRALLLRATRAFRAESSRDAPPMQRRGENDARRSWNQRPSAAAL